MSVVLLQYDKYHAHMPVDRMYLHIIRTEQGDENSYIIFFYLMFAIPKCFDIYRVQMCQSITQQFISYTLK
jgi:hypothetical protein